MLWEICKKTGFDVNENWYNHEPHKVAVNGSWKILCDVTIQTKYAIEARRPEMVVRDKTENECKIVDSARPFDSRIEEMETVERLQRSQNKN